MIFVSNEIKKETNVDIHIASKIDKKKVKKSIMETSWNWKAAISNEVKPFSLDPTTHFEERYAPGKLSNGSKRGTKGRALGAAGVRDHPVSSRFRLSSDVSTATRISNLGFSSSRPGRASERTNPKDKDRQNRRKREVRNCNFIWG